MVAKIQDTNNGYNIEDTDSKELSEYLNKCNCKHIIASEATLNKLHVYGFFKPTITIVNKIKYGVIYVNKYN